MFSCRSWKRNECWRRDGNAEKALWDPARIKAWSRALLRQEHCIRGLAPRSQFGADTTAAQTGSMSSDLWSSAPFSPSSLQWLSMVETFVYKANKMRRVVGRINKITDTNEGSRWIKRHGWSRRDRRQGLWTRASAQQGTFTGFVWR